MANFLDGIDWANIPWIRTTVRGEYESKSGARNEVNNPPSSGWQHAFIVKGETHSTIFCPFTFQSFHVSNGAYEVVGAKNADEAFRPDYIRDLITRNWLACKRHGTPGASYDVAAIIMSKFGWEFPIEEESESETEEGARRGGKPAADKLLRKVAAKSKRGDFLKWFLENPNGRSVRGAMVHFDMKRRAVMSMWFNINRDNGIGYTLTGDTIAVHLPATVKDKPKSCFRK